MLTLLNKDISGFFQKYLHESDYETSLDLFPGLNLNFHWANAGKLVSFYRENMKDGKLHPSFLRLIDACDRLKGQHFWIRMEDSILPMTMFDVYSSFMRSIKQGDFDPILMKPQYISFISPTGSYKKMSFETIVDQRSFYDFLQYNLLHNKLPLRSFRINTQGNILVDFGEQLEHQSTLRVVQITDAGILVSSKDALILDEAQKDNAIFKVFMDSSAFDQLRGLNLGEETSFAQGKQDLFFTHHELKYFFIESKNIRYTYPVTTSEEDHYFMFFRYHHMLESELPRVVKEFVEIQKNRIFDNVA